MRFSILVPALMAAVATSAPTDVKTTRDIMPVGQACSGENFTGTCVELLPGRCRMAFRGEFGLDRNTASIQIEKETPCVFFDLEACINPTGKNTYYVQGPAQIATVDSGFSRGISGYLCGPLAEKFASKEPQKEVEGIALERLARRQDDFGPPDGSATLFKAQNFIGDRIPTDKIAVPGGGFCNNLDRFFGKWEDETRSLAVHPGQKCKFFVEYDCPAEGVSFEAGKEGDYDRKETLEEAWDKKIRSVVCVDI